MKDPRRGDSIYDVIAHYNKMRLLEEKRKAEQRKKFGISGAFKFPKSKGANSAEMRKGK
jgi:hypothetical protein